MNVFPYYLLRITVQTSVQKSVKECLNHFFVLTRLSNLIVQARRAFRVRYRPVSTRPATTASRLSHQLTDISPYSVSSPSVLGQRHLDLVATTR